jgi:predicted metal-dependent phosphoesterase TrpH
MVDLHLHTNASDGRCSPPQLVERAARAGLEVISVVDHDTVLALPETDRVAGELGLRYVSGIEITAVEDGTDVHVLGYGFDPSSERLELFLESQRRNRLERVRTILERLSALGVPVGFEAVIEKVQGRVPQTIGRPQIARAMVRAGHVPDTRTAFDLYLAEGRQAFVPRLSASPAEVVDLIVSCGGVASLAHPGLLRRDDLIPVLVAAGMRAIEVYHPDHDADAVGRYQAVAGQFGLASTGGSDFHADDEHGENRLGRITLPVADFERFESLLRTGSGLICGNHASG